MAMNGKTSGRVVRLDTISNHPFDQHVVTMKARHQAAVIASELMAVMAKHDVPLGLGSSMLCGMLAAGIGAEVTGSAKRRALTKTEMAHALSMAEECRSYIERQLVDWGAFGKL